MSTDPRLVAIGDAIERAVATDLRASGVPVDSSESAAVIGTHDSRRRLRWRPRRRVTVLSAALAIAVPGAAVAATQLMRTDSQVAASLPQGTRALGGTHPTCTAVVANVEYHCTLASAPSSIAGGPDGGPQPGAKGESPKALALRLRSELGKARGHELRLNGVILIRERGRQIAFVKGGSSTVPYLPAPRPTARTRGWLGTVEPTVDSSRHVNGGCRALNAAGTSWECYIGEAAVRQTIISQGFLGQYAPSPGIG